MRLLLVEDNPGDARLIKEHLRELRHSQGIKQTQIELSHVETLSDAMDQLEAATPDAVLLDLSLPDSAGSDTLASVCSKYPKIPVIVLTGLEDEQLAVALLEEGAQDYLPKGRVTAELLGKSLQYAVVRQRAAVERTRSRELLQASIDALPLRVAIFDSNGNIVFTNEMWESYATTNPEVNTHCGVNYLEALVKLADCGKPEFARVRELIDDTISRNDRAYLEISEECPGGTIWTSVNVSSFGDGDASYLILAYEDITQRIRAEEVIRASQKQLQAILDNAPALIWGKGRDGRYHFANTQFARMRRMHSREIVGNTDERLGFQDIATQLPVDDKAVLSSGVPVLRVISESQEGGSYMVSKFPLFDNEGSPQAVCTIAIDISAQHAAESALRETEARYREVTSNIPGIVCQVRHREGETELTFISEGIRSITGLGGEELMKNPMRLLSFCPEADRESLRAAVESTLQNGESFSRVIDVEDVEGNILHFRVEANPRTSISGDTIWDVILLDVSEQHRLEELLQLSQRLDSVGKLAGGVAHDFNNLLTVISGRAKMALRHLESESPAKRNIDVIQSTAERATELVSQLLAFGRKQVMRVGQVNVNGLLMDLQPMIRTLLPESITCHFDMESEVGAVEVDKVRLEQVIMNLVANARDAMPGGGALVIETRELDNTEGESVPHPLMGSGRYVLIAVRDTGVGMDSETAKHAFEPFYTRKENGKGTGLGLATVYGIVKQSNGWVWLDSKLGEGTTVEVYLPLCERPGENSAETAAVEPVKALRGSENILVVEDEPDLREFVREELDAFGYKVTVADSPDAALKRLPTLGKVDLLLTDIVMPGRSGIQLAQEILQLSPETRVLYMSGYSEEIMARSGGLQKGIVLLEKPFSSERLLQEVRKQLDG